MAAAGGGRYYSAANEQQLRNALGQATGVTTAPAPTPTGWPSNRWMVALFVGVALFLLVCAGAVAAAVLAARSSSAQPTPGGQGVTLY